MANTRERYAGAVRSTDLRTRPAGLADVDLLGAAGMAGKRNDLALLLARAQAGDNQAMVELVPILGQLVWGKARALKLKVKRDQAADLARAVLAWHRDSGCRDCGSRGFRKVPGAPTLSGEACGTCSGSGRIPFDRLIDRQNLELTRWLQALVEREFAAAATHIGTMIDAA